MHLIKTNALKKHMIDNKVCVNADLAKITYKYVIPTISN